MRVHVRVCASAVEACLLSRRVCCRGASAVIADRMVHAGWGRSAGAISASEAATTGGVATAAGGAATAAAAGEAAMACQDHVYSAPDFRPTIPFTLSYVILPARVSVVIHKVEVVIRYVYGMGERTITVPGMPRCGKLRGVELDLHR